MPADATTTMCKGAVDERLVPPALAQRGVSSSRPSARPLPRFAILEQLLERRHDLDPPEHDDLPAFPLIGWSAIRTEQLQIGDEPSIGAEHLDPCLAPMIGTDFDAGLAHGADRSEGFS